MQEKQTNIVADRGEQGDPCISLCLVIRWECNVCRHEAGGHALSSSHSLSVSVSKPETVLAATNVTILANKVQCLLLGLLLIFLLWGCRSEASPLRMTVITIITQTLPPPSCCGLNISLSEQGSGFWFHEKNCLSTQWDSPPRSPPPSPWGPGISQKWWQGLLRGSGTQSSAPELRQTSHIQELLKRPPGREPAVKRQTRGGGNGPRFGARGVASVPRTGGGVGGTRRIVSLSAVLNGKRPPLARLWSVKAAGSLFFYFLLRNLPWVLMRLLT